MSPRTGAARCGAVRRGWQQEERGSAGVVYRALISPGDGSSCRARLLTLELWFGIERGADEAARAPELPPGCNVFSLQPVSLSPLFSFFISSPAATPGRSCRRKVRGFLPRGSARHGSARFGTCPRQLQRAPGHHARRSGSPRPAPQGGCSEAGATTSTAPTSQRSPPGITAGTAGVPWGRDAKLPVGSRGGALEQRVRGLRVHASSPEHSWHPLRLQHPVAVTRRGAGSERRASAPRLRSQPGAEPQSESPLWDGPPRPGSSGWLHVPMAEVQNRPRRWAPPPAVTLRPGLLPQRRHHRVAAAAAAAAA